MAKSIPDQLPMFDRMTYEGSPSAISSPALEGGVTRSDAPDGLTNARSGPEAAPVSHFQPRTSGKAEDKAAPIRGIFGPSWFRLIEQRRPATIFGEQVTAAIKFGWLDEVFRDLERLDYACGTASLPACSVGASHLRRRLWFVADARGARWEGHQPVECVSVTAQETQPFYSDTLTRARRALDGDLSGLLSCDGLSVQLERDTLRCYGNAIVPQVAQVFIEAYMSIQ